MEINYLREFVELAQSCQFQETAENLYISQSALSKHIKAIEKELGAELFIRSTRRVELSETGKAFLAYASQIAQLQQDYTNEIIKANSEKKFKIAADSQISLRQIEKILADIIADHPNIRVELSEEDKNALRSMLRKGNCDLIVACRDLSDTDTDFCSVPYYVENLVAVMSESHPLAKKDKITIQEAREYPLIQNGSINFAQYLDPTIASARYKTVRGSLGTQILNISQAICIAPSNGGRFLISNDLADHLIMLPIEPTVQINIDIIYMKNKKNSPFIQEIIQNIDPTKEVYAEQKDIDFSKLTTTCV
jgi:DNA-binding transcriptional LysR family regulator